MKLGWIVRDVGDSSSGDRERMIAVAFDEIGAAERGDALEAAHALVRWSMRLLDVSGAGVMLTDDRGLLRSVMVTSDLVSALEAAELRHGRGPCVESHRKAAAVVHPDIHVADTRWPEFGLLARSGGVRAVHAVPVVGDGTAIGVLNLFRTTPGGLSDVEAALAQAFADIAGTAVHRRTASRPRPGLPNGLGGAELAAAVADAAIVQRATGMLAARLRIGIDTAHAVLQRVAVDRDLDVRRLADGVVAGTATITLPLSVTSQPPDVAGTD
jgi:GAF domain-containing protein